MAAVSQLTAAGGAGAAKAAAARALAAAYRAQVGGGLHVKPLALLLTGISIQALAEVDGVKGEGGRGERLMLVVGEVKGVGGECEGLQGGEGALVLIAKRLHAQVCVNKHAAAVCASVLTSSFIHLSSD